MSNNFDYLKSAIEETKRFEYAEKCNHKWVFQNSDYEYKYCEYGISEYKRIDTYYCENCLEQKEIVAKNERSRETPYWFKRG